jgi:hypothetical protein
VRERDGLSPTVCGAPMQLRPIRGAGSCAAEPFCLPVPMPSGPGLTAGGLRANLNRDEQRRYRAMTDRERRQYDDQLAEDAQRRYERMTDPERQRYLDDLQSEQRRLDSARRR